MKIYLKNLELRNSKKNPIGFFENFTRKDYLGSLEEEYIGKIVKNELFKRAFENNENIKKQPPKLTPSEAIKGIESPPNELTDRYKKFSDNLSKALNYQSANSKKLIKERLGEIVDDSEKSKFIDDILLQLTKYYRVILKAYVKSPYLYLLEEHVILIYNVCRIIYPSGFICNPNKTLLRLITKHDNSIAVEFDLRHTIIEDLKDLFDERGVAVIEIKSESDLVDAFKKLRLSKLAEIKSPIQFICKHGYATTAYYVIRLLCKEWKISESLIAQHKILEINKRPYNTNKAQVALSRADESTISLKSQIGTTFLKHSRKI